MTPEEKIWRLKVALRNSMSSINAIRDIVDVLIAKNATYKSLIAIVEYCQEEAKQLLQELDSEEEEGGKQ
jgi:hypothetical protein